MGQHQDISAQAVIQMGDFTFSLDFEGGGWLGVKFANPVIRGLVKHPRDWPWSRWSFYEKGEVGLIRVDVEE
jgi:hypothetical protein